MIIVMRPTATQDDVEVILHRLADDGLTGEPLYGAERVVIGVIGTGFAPDYSDHLESMPGVESATRITKSYKLASRDFRPIDTVIDVNGIKIGNGEFVVMAGPCSVEGLDHVVGVVGQSRSGEQAPQRRCFKPRPLL